MQISCGGGGGSLELKSEGTKGPFWRMDLQERSGLTSARYLTASLLPKLNRERSFQTNANVFPLAPADDIIMARLLLRNAASRGAKQSNKTSP